MSLRTHLCQRPATHRALTLVELMIGTALTAMLMVGVMVSIRGLSAGAALPTARLPEDATLDAALQTLAWDVAHARLVRVAESDNGSVLTLAGLGALARTQPADPHLTPAVVTYAVVHAGGRPLLVRRQRDLPEADAAGAGAGLVLAGVSTFHVRAVRPVRTPGAAPGLRDAADRAIAAAAGLPPTAPPRTLSVRVAVDGKSPRAVRMPTGAQP